MSMFRKLHQPDLSSKDDLPPEDGKSDDPSVQLFDFENYCAEPESAPDAGTRGSPGPPSRFSRFEPDHEQVGSSDVTALSQTHVDAFPGNRSEPSRAPSWPPTTPGNEPSHQYGQQSNTEIPNAELHSIEDELEEVELRLKRRELLKRRQELLQNASTWQQAQSSDRPEPQNLSMASDVRAQSNSQHVASNDASQRSDPFPTANVPFNKDWVAHSYDTNLGTSSRDSIQTLNAGVDSRYAVASTDPSCFGFADLPSNAYGESSFSESLGQSGKADAELPSIESVHMFSGMPAELYSPGSNHQYEMQTPVAALVSDQTPVQSSLTNLQHGSGLDPIQSVSTLSSFHHDRPKKNYDTNMIIRKRLRSPQPTEVQRLSTIQNQLSKKTGVPEISIGVMCFNAEPRPKRNRTSSQKQNKKIVEDVGGSCFLCLVHKKKCSGQRPCENCRSYWQKRIHNSTSFMWTCDVQSKLTDFNVFRYPLEGISELEFNATMRSQLGVIKTFTDNYPFLFNLAEMLDPSKTKMFLKIIDSDESFQPLYLHVYGQIIPHWKRVLVDGAPKLQQVLAFFEKVHRFMCSELLSYCELVHKSPHKDRAVMVVAFLLDKVNHLMRTETLNPSVVDHLQLALQNRLKVFCHRFFDFDGSKKISNTRGWNTLCAAMMVDHVQGLSWCLPPRYHGCSSTVFKVILDCIPVSPPATPKELPSCLLRRFDGSVYCYDYEEIDTCCCGWTFDSTPSDSLKFFGYSAQSFARFIHSEPQEDTRQALNIVFRGPWTGDTSLRNRMVVFGETLSFWHWHSSISMKYVIEELQSYAITEKVEAKLDCQAKSFRSRDFAYILRSAVSMYHELWNSEGEGKAVIEVANKEYWKFAACAFGKKTGKAADNRFSLVRIQEGSVEAVRCAADDTGISSHKDGTSDELEDRSIEQKDPVLDDTDMSPNEDSTSDQFSGRS